MDTGRKEYLKTNGLRYNDKGRHTTTRRELCLFPSGGMVIDTPGDAPFKRRWKREKEIAKLIKKMAIKR